MSSKSTKINILVTGGAGFIGSNFVKYIVSHYGVDAHIIILDALTYAANLNTICQEIESPDVTFIKGSICESALVCRIFTQYDIDWVVNFAAETHVDRSIDAPRIFLETNVMGTQVLLDAALAAWRKSDGTYSEGKKFLQISTDEVYGSLPKDWNMPREIDVDDKVADVIRNRKSKPVAFGEKFFTETTPLSPRSPYSASKAAADMLVMAYYHTFGLPVCITRCSNNYGEYQFPEKLIPLIINNIVQGRRLPVYGRGENVRDWLYVGDHVKAIHTVLQKGRVGEVYNIGGFNEEININIVKHIIRIVAKAVSTSESLCLLLKIAPEEVNESLIDYVADRPGHDMRYAINPYKIVTELGWYPETPFVEGIEKTVMWNLENRAWIESVISGQYYDYYEKMYNNR